MRKRHKDLYFIIELSHYQIIKLEPEVITEVKEGVVAIRTAIIL